MKLIAIVAVSCALVLTAVPASAEFKRIKTEAQFKSTIAGKRIENENSWFVIAADGTSKGKVRGKKWVGAWVWQKTYYCSNGRLGEKAIGSKCHYWEVDGNKARLLRDRGKGDVSIYEIK